MFRKPKSLSVLCFKQRVDTKTCARPTRITCRINHQSPQHGPIFYAPNSVRFQLRPSCGHALKFANLRRSIS